MYFKCTLFINYGFKMSLTASKKILKVVNFGPRCNPYHFWKNLASFKVDFDWLSDRNHLKN